MIKPVERLIRQIAMNCLGLEIEENPPSSNKGFWVEEFQKAGGGGPGDAWCCHFVVWVWDEVFGILGGVSPLKVTGWCYAQWAHCIARPEDFKIIHAENIDDATELGAGGIWIRFDALKKGHTGIVLEVKNGWMKSIEGNQSDGVRETRRKISDISDFKGIIYLKP